MHIVSTGMWSRLDCIVYVRCPWRQGFYIAVSHSATALLKKYQINFDEHSNRHFPYFIAMDPTLCKVSGGCVENFEVLELNP